MQNGLWTCAYKGCQSSADQIASLRLRKPTGFPHDEDPNIRVCTVCRRLPLRSQVEDEQPLDGVVLAGISEELSSLEENDNNVQALSQVFRYYAKHAKQLSQVLFDFVTKQCFPWELIHALHLVDDILLMDNSCRYKAELLDRVQAMTVTAFNKVQKDSEKREVAKMLHAWRELKIFEATVVDAVRAAIRDTGGDKAAQLLSEAAAEAAEEVLLESAPVLAGSTASPPPPKKAKVAETPVEEARTVSDNGRPPPEAETPQPVQESDMQSRALAAVERILNLPLERPFQILGIAEERVTGQDIRSAYRRIALLVHPDKNPGMEAQCQEALVKLQQTREQAETELQKKRAGVTETVTETRSAASAAAASATVDTSFKCKYPGCDQPPCRQCPNGCCTRNITHCHLAARNGGMQCFFHPPPRAWARNA